MDNKRAPAHCDERLVPGVSYFLFSKLKELLFQNSEKIPNLQIPLCFDYHTEEFFFF